MKAVPHSSFMKATNISSNIVKHGNKSQKTCNLLFLEAHDSKHKIHSLKFSCGAKKRSVIF